MKYILPKISNIIFLSILSSVILMGPQTFNMDGDLGRHITIGGYILNNFSIPIKDIFSHTMYGKPLTPHEWMAQVIFAGSHQLFSLGGPVLAVALIIAGAFSFVYRESSQRSQMPLTSLALTILAAAASSIHWLARPHVFTFLFLAVWTSLFEKVQKDKNVPVWHFAILMLLWANTHGAFIAGFVVWGAYTAGYLIDAFLENQFDVEKFLRWLIIGGVSFLATLFNPSGPLLWQTSVGYVGNSYLVSHTVEYQSVDFHIPGAWPFLLIILFSVLVLSYKRQRLASAHSLLIAGWMVMGLYSARNIPLFAIVASPILAETIARIFTNFRWKTVEHNFMAIEASAHGVLWPVTGILCAILLLNTPTLRAYNTYDPSIFPVDAVNWLDENPQEGRVFNSFTWGGYLLYRDWPNQLVFIDGQTDFYGEELTREYETLITMDNDWETILEKYEINWAVIEANSPLAQSLIFETRWKIIYQDDTAIILRK